MKAPSFQARTLFRRAGLAVASTGMRTYARLLPLPRHGAVARRAPRRITVFALWGIGDAIHLLPLLRSLKRGHPEAELEVVGPAFHEDLLRNDPGVDRITVLTPPWTAAHGKYRFWNASYRHLFRWIRARRRERRDWIVTTRGDVREHFLAAMMGGRRRFGFGTKGRWPLLSERLEGLAPLEGERHFAEVGRDVARQLGGGAAEPGPTLHVSEAERVRARTFLAERRLRGRPLLGIHAGASFPIRAWPAERFGAAVARLAGRIGGVLVIEDPQGSWSEIGLPPGLRAARFRGGLREVLALLSELDVVLCNDSGIMHVAAAVGTRVVAPFGPTSVTWFGPCGTGHEVVRHPAIRCGPCVDRCPLGDARCITSVEVERVASALSRALDATVVASAAMKCTAAPTQNIGRLPSSGDLERPSSPPTSGLNPAACPPIPET